MKILATIEDCAIFVLGDGTITFLAKAAIDADGSGDSHGDPDFQPETSLKQFGKSLNSDTEKFIVVPPIIIRSVRPVVLGCQTFVTNTKNGLHSEAVVGDIGPAAKLGEISIALANALGIDPSPTTGGESEHVIHYSVQPGRPALVDGKVYDLQPS